MATNFFPWLFLSDEGLVWRIAGGVAILAAMALWELCRKRAAARRWKEYGFLLLIVAAAMAYGIVNDQITCTISWEYFYCHDDAIAAALGPKLPPDPVALRREAFKLGMKATWTAGLLVGVAMLLANNPHKVLPQLPYRKLVREAMIPLAGAALLAVTLGLVQWLRYSSSGVHSTEARFMAVQGVHLGGYIGGAVGAAVVVWHIRRRRRAAVTGNQ